MIPYEPDISGNFSVAYRRDGMVYADPLVSLKVITGDWRGGIIMSEMEIDKETRWDLIVFWLVFIWLWATDWSGGILDW